MLYVQVGAFIGATEANTVKKIQEAKGGVMFVDVRCVCVCVYVCVCLVFYEGVYQECVRKKRGVMFVDVSPVCVCVCVCV